MLVVLLVPALAGVLLLCIHLALELNSLEKSLAGLSESIKKRYETERSVGADQPKGS